MPLVMSTTVGKLAAALASAQAEMSPAKKNATNPHFRSTYADLASLHDASRAALAKHGLAVVQLPGRRDDGTTTVTTLIMHASGEFVGDEAGVKLALDTAQAAGSVISYLRRYGYAAVLGLSAEDDDGAAASASASQPPRRDDRPAERPTGRRASEFDADAQLWAAAGAAVAAASASASQPPRRDDRPAERPALQPAEPAYAAPAEVLASGDRNDPPCPICSGAMWDNRAKKAAGTMNAKAPDFKCKDKTGCEGVIWPPRSGGARPRVQAASPPPLALAPAEDDNGEIPF